VRPASGAETPQKDAAAEISDPLERAEVAAAEDGRTPVNRYWTNRPRSCSRALLNQP